MVINVYTDGSCSCVSRLGGWGAIIIMDGKEIGINGSEKNTTNNRMEIMAVVNSLFYIYSKELISNEIHIYSDSQYVVNGFNEWCEKWKAKNWKNVKNSTHWKALLMLTSILNIKFHWVRGHDGNEYNEKADKLAYRAYSELTE